MSQSIEQCQKEHDAARQLARVIHAQLPSRQRTRLLDRAYIEIHKTWRALKLAKGHRAPSPQDLTRELAAQANDDASSAELAKIAQRRAPIPPTSDRMEKIAHADALRERERLREQRQREAAELSKAGHGRLLPASPERKCATELPPFLDKQREARQREAAGRARLDGVEVA